LAAGENLGMSDVDQQSPGAWQSDTATKPAVSAFLTSGGEMAALIAGKDWAATPLGPRHAWPQSLQTALRILVTSRYSMWLGWGPELRFFYNDAYGAATLGAKHPWALGRPASEVWSEIWSDIGPRAEAVVQTGEATWDEGLLLFLERSGYPEETYHTFSYSPLPNDDGTVGGMLSVVIEETERVIGERRMATLRELAVGLAAVRTEPDVSAAIKATLSNNQRDLPFTAAWLFDTDGAHARLACVTGIEPGHPIAATAIDIADLAPGDAIVRILAGVPHVVIEDLARFGTLPTGAWDEQPRRALAVPIVQQGEARPAGMLLAALNPFRPLNESYTGFIDLVASQIASGLASARAYEAERQRAEALAEIDRAKTAFFSNVSHEFRTPLTLMLGPLEEQLAEQDGAAAERLRMAHRNGLRLLRLVNTLLDFSRIEAGRVRAAFRPTDLAAYTAELASNFRSACERAGLDLTVDCPKLPHAVYVDADMWERVVLNLVSNAFKYTLEGGIRVTVRANHDRTAELLVSDTGVGIPAQELPRVFDRFHRIEGQGGRTMEGTGIGLALVHELVRLHGGNIAVQSMAGAGTTVSIALPFGHAHLPAAQVSQDRGRTMPEGSAAASFVEEALRWLPQSERTSGLDAGLLDAGAALVGFGTDTSAANVRHRILLADDNADMRDYVMRLLGTQYDVQAVPDGEAALHAIHARRPDLLLSDVMMPRLDGFGLLAAVRAEPRWRDIPVILLSARAGEEAHVEGLDAGADDYLVKPFAARELLARVRSNLELARIRREAADQIREEARRLELLNRTGAAIAAELDLERLVQAVTDAAVELTGAQFGAFFSNVLDESGESYTLYTSSGAPREAFSDFPMPRNTEVFDPTFKGEGIVRSGDIMLDPRYGQNAPWYGKPPGHLPVRSYLAVPVVSHSGEVLGGLFFGHSDVNVFTERDELIVGGIAAQAATGIDNARLYRASRQAQESLRLLNETLEQRVADEIAERMRTEEALRQAQKMEAVGQLTGGIAHDFNNLLTAICGGADTLQRLLPQPLGANEARIRRALRMIDQGAQRAATLTHRLLAFARRQALDPRPVDANKLVAGMSELLRRTLGEPVVIETVLAGGLWRTMTDPNQLESALLNLAVNARDAMPEGGKLTIETANSYLDEGYVAQHQEVVPGQYVMIAVSDSGTGMARETIEHVFEPFFTTKEVGQGTGLGLSQVYGFIKQSNGHIKIYSELGQGTVVKLYLPRLTGDTKHALDDELEAEAPPGGSGELILVVEDDDDVRAYSTETLRELGYRVLIAPNGPAGLEVLARHPGIRLLFTDVGLPGGMTGRQLADQARRQRPDLLVLFTTGYARNAIVHGGILDPGTHLLPKPFTHAGLATKIRELLDER
jgi:signal transduction histidine kinase/DNA-binding response OmpR family regulator